MGNKHCSLTMNSRSFSAKLISIQLATSLSWCLGLKLQYLAFFPLSTTKLLLTHFYTLLRSFWVVDAHPYQIKVLVSCSNVSRGYLLRVHCLVIIIINDDEQ